MPGRSDNLNVFDPYPFADVPDFQVGDPDPNPETLGLQAYADQPPQPHIPIAPLILPVVFGAGYGFSSETLFYLPNEVLPIQTASFGVGFGFEIFNLVLDFGIGYGFSYQLPPTVTLGVGYGFEAELSDEVELTAVSNWPMNESSFLDTISGQNFSATTGRYTSNPYLDDIEVVTGAGGYVRLSAGMSPNFVTQTNSLFISDGNSLQVSFEFLFEEEDTDLEIGSGAVRVLPNIDDRFQWAILIQYSPIAGLFDYQVTVQFFLENPNGTFQVEPLEFRTNLNLNVWNEITATFNLTRKETTVDLNGLINSRLFAQSNLPAKAATNPGFYIREPFYGVLRLRDIEYSKGVISSAPYYVVFGVGYGFEVESSGGSGGGATLIASWEMNDSLWTESELGLNFAIAGYAGGTAYSDTPTVVTGTNGYTVFDEDAGGTGLHLTTAYDGVFTTSGNPVFEFEFNAPSLPYGFEATLFESGRVIEYEMQWYIRLFFDYGNGVHVIAVRIWLDDGFGFYYETDVVSSLTLTAAAWNQVKVTFRFSALEVVFDVNTSSETLPIPVTDPPHIVADSAISIGEGSWSAPVWLRKIRLLEE